MTGGVYVRQEERAVSYLGGGTAVSWIALRSNTQDGPLMLVDALFRLAIELCRGVVRRRVFDGLARQTDRDLGL
jgi:hypothetical protein